LNDGRIPDVRGVRVDLGTGTVACKEIGGRDETAA
jgi:hypothetical protein